jgi:hypothetical protein
MEKNSINEAFQNTLVNDSIKNISLEYLELGVDSFVKNDFIREIPIIKSLYSFYKAVESIHAYYLTKKVVRFLFQFKDVSKTEIENTLLKLETTKSYKKDLGENLILIIDRFENVQKSDLLGKAFKMFLKGESSYEEFLRISHIIDKSFLDDLYKLPFIQKSINVELITKENLFSLGLLSLKPHDVKAGMTGQEFMVTLKEVDFILNDSARLIIKVLEEK